MKLAIIPPHEDATLVPVAPPGFELLALHRRFVDRMLSAEQLDAALAGCTGETADAMGVRLRLLVARAQLARQPRGSLPFLFAANAALSALTASPAPFQLRLDDLELSHGRSTERSADVRAALNDLAPWQPELDGAVAAAARADTVRLQLDRDQQLPSVLRLLTALRGKVTEVAGHFAHLHAEALQRLPEFAGVKLLPDEARFRVGDDAGPWFQPHYLGPAPERQPRTDAETARASAAAPPGEPWAGYATAEALISGLGAAARTVVIAFCALSPDELLSATGVRVPVSAVQRAIEARRAAGLHTYGEWMVGAPGVDLTRHQQTATLLTERPLFDWLVGLRRFHWARQRTVLRFDGQPVALGAPESDRDLFRALPVLSPATGESLDTALAAMTAPLFANRPGAPARVAQAVVGPPPPARQRSAAPACVRRSPECEVVPLPRALDGSPRPTFYAVNLCAGTTMALDGRLAPTVLGLERPTPIDAAFPQVPVAQREKLCAQLIVRQILEGSAA